MTTVVNLRRETYDVYIGRPGIGESGYFGNPIEPAKKCPECRSIHWLPGSTIRCFRAYFMRRITEDAEFRRAVHRLSGLRLGCFCKPAPCHGDVYVEYLEKTMEDKRTRLSLVQSEVERCEECGLHETRTHTVFHRGSFNARLMFVGEAPGQQEDETGRPFVGPAGELLDRAIKAMGLDDSDVYVCNSIKCRPPDNRAPTDEEMAACNVYLRCQIDIVQPKVIVALGKTAVKALGLPITKDWRGQWGYSREAIPVMATYHPSYLLRTPSKKKVVGKDLAAVLKKLETTKR